MGPKIFCIEQDEVEYYLAALGEHDAIDFACNEDFIVEDEDFTIDEIPETEWDKHHVHDQETGEPIKSFRAWLDEEVNELPDCIASTMEW